MLKQMSIVKLNIRVIADPLFINSRGWLTINTLNTSMASLGNFAFKLSR